MKFRKGARNWRSIFGTHTFLGSDPPLPRPSVLVMVAQAVAWAPLKNSPLGRRFTANRRLGGPKIALRGGWHGRPAKEGGGGGGFQKWASVPGPLFCVRTDVATKGAGTQILAWKKNFHEKIFPHICVVKMISTTWGSF